MTTKKNTTKRTSKPAKPKAKATELSPAKAKEFRLEHRSGLENFLRANKRDVNFLMAPPGHAQDITRYGVHQALVKAKAKEPFSSGANLTALGVKAEVVQAYLWVIFPCKVSVTQGDSEDSLVAKEHNLGC